MVFSELLTRGFTDVEKTFRIKGQFAGDTACEIPDAYALADGPRTVVGVLRFVADVDVFALVSRKRAVVVGRQGSAARGGD